MGSGEEHTGHVGETMAEAVQLRGSISGTDTPASGPWGSVGGAGGSC